VNCCNRRIAPNVRCVSAITPQYHALTYGVQHAIEHARMERFLDELPNRLERLRDDRTLGWPRHKLRDDQAG